MYIFFAHTGALNDAMPLRNRFQNNPLRNAIYHRFHMGNDSEHFPLAFLSTQAIEYIIQCIGIKRSEALVHEQRIYANVTARIFCNTQGEGETDQEFFTTRKVTRSPKKSSLTQKPNSPDMTN